MLHRRLSWALLLEDENEIVLSHSFFSQSFLSITLAQLNHVIDFNISIARTKILRLRSAKNPPLSRLLNASKNLGVGCTFTLLYRYNDCKEYLYSSDLRLPTANPFDGKSATD